LPSFFKNLNYRISYSKIENVKEINQIKHNAIRKFFEYKNLKKIELSINSDLPARSGLGSSATFLVGLNNSISNLIGKKIGYRELYEDAINFEQNILKEACGSQDQVIVSVGGFRAINYSHNGIGIHNINISNKRKLNFENSLVLFFTGFSRTSSQIEKKKINNIFKNKEKYMEIYNLSVEAKKIFENKNSNLNEIGKLLNESWNIKKKLAKEVSNSCIDEMYDCGIRNGAIGGKILGAGNGGFMLFYVKPENKKKLISSMKNLIYVPVKFSNQGSQIIHKTSEKIKI
jgi:D-glycero-alpha-D-manno-heptose-7-phosphate kinase